MKKQLFLILICSICFMDAYSQAWKDKLKNIEKELIHDKPLSNEEVISGLKEALTVGTNNSTTLASKIDGFYGNPLIKIPFPPDAAALKERFQGTALQPQIDKFEESLNRAAEIASKDAADIFIKAITGMSIGDGFTILKGNDDAATNYLKENTSKELHEKFKPIIKEAINKVKVTKHWEPLATKYNKIPMIKKVNPDLNEYVTLKATEGLFKLIAEEELKIRKDPAARVNDLLKRVFGEKK